MADIKEFEMYKYFKGEQENPFAGKDQLAALWWNGEKSFHDKTQSDPDFINTVGKMLMDAVEANDVDGILADETVDINKRILVFYLDLWHSKWFPYNDLDLIFKY
ncbi:MAG: hypothetical protein VB130_12595 [Clostridium sp.]|nr:hypothetical protein [Clostridium sp.]